MDPKDIEGIDKKVISHKSNVETVYTIVKQKCNFSLEKRKAIEKRNGQTSNYCSIYEAQYSKLLANIVMVKKAKGK